MNIFELPVHPAADVFPMLDTDELSDLAADIKTNGLQHPIIIGEVGGVEMLIDGRNRLAACKLAKVEPEVKQLNGQDPEALILSENIMRRHMTKGQRAMAVAMMYPEAEMGRGNSNVPKSLGLSTEYIRQARTVLKNSKTLAEQVLAGAPSLSVAYEQVLEVERKAAQYAEDIEKLKSDYPELAQEVVDDSKDLYEQIAIARHRDSVEAEELTKDDALLQNACESLSSGIHAVASLSSGDGLDRLLARIEEGGAKGLLRNYFRNGVEDISESRDRFLKGVERIKKFMEVL